MKIETQEVFKPVVLTMETKEEATAVLEAVTAAIPKATGDEKKMLQFIAKAFAQNEQLQ